jgi:predicted aspartyl protease
MRALAAFIVALLPACALRAQTPTAWTAPVAEAAIQRSPEGLVAVPVHMRGAAYSFLLDTGASSNTVASKVARELGLASHAQAQAVGAGGSMGEEPLVKLPPMDLGGVTLPSMDAAVGDIDAAAGAPSGILGRDFLLLHDTEVDLAHERLRLFPPGSSRRRADLDASFARVPFSEAVGLVRVDVRIDGGEPIPAIVDLGASSSIANVEAARRSGFALGAEPGQGQGAATAVGADGRRISVTRHTFATLGLGDLAIASPAIVVGDLPVFDALGLGKGPAVLLGLDMLERRVVVLDYANREIVISRKPSGGA